MVFGAFVFGIAALKMRHQGLSQAAHYCMVLALIALFPTIVLGLMDWQYFYGGGWLFPIKIKLALAALLLILLVFAVSAGYRAESISKQALIIYTLCFLNVTALGYFGGELVYGGRIPGKLSNATTSTADDNIEAGAALYNQTCRACHPDGGNSIKKNLPLKAAPQLVTFDTFLAYIRSPKARDGSATIMPSFHVEKLSDKQVSEIYHYVIQVLGKN
jgi:mono/diheme cytochrome c family protein